MIKLEDLRSNDEQTIWFYPCVETFTTLESIEKFKSINIGSHVVLSLTKSNTLKGAYILAHDNQSFLVRVKAPSTDIDDLLSHDFYQISFVVNHCIDQTLPDRSNLFEAPHVSADYRKDSDFGLVDFEYMQDIADQDINDQVITEQDGIEQDIAVSERLIQARRDLASVAIEVRLVFFRRYRVLNDVLNILPASSTIDDNTFTSYLRDCTFKFNHKLFCFVSPNKKGVLIFDSNTEKNERRVVNSKNTSFLLIGKNQSINVSVEFNKESYILKGELLKNRTFSNMMRKSNMCLLNIDKLTCDRNIKNPMSGLVANQSVNEATQNPSVYLDLWAIYNSLERKVYFNQAQVQGYALYNGFTPQDRGIVDFYLSHEYEFSFKAGDFIEISEEKPTFIDQEEVNVDDDDDYRYYSQIKIIGQVISVSKTNHTLCVDLRDWDIYDLPSSGYIFISTQGAKVMNDRRNRALDALMSGGAHLNKLGDFFNLEDRGSVEVLAFRQNRRRHYEALTDKVCSKVFKNSKPTDNQKQAVEVALNTPDIALIQGPPGTGKTTVIQAIVERLNEILHHEKKDYADCSAQILISSSQHEAVDNAISKLNINSMPTFKFGVSSNKGDKDDPNDRFKRACAQWQDNLSQDLFDLYADQFKPNESTFEAQRAIAYYECEPTEVNALRLVEAVEKLPSYVFDDDLRLKLQIERDTLSQRSTPIPQSELDSIFCSIYALRTDPVSYEDDGLYSLKSLVLMLKNIPNADSLKQRLQELSVGPNAYTQGSEVFFEELKRLQNDLLDYFQPEPFQIHAEKRKSMMDLISAVTTRINATAANYEVVATDELERKKLQIVAEFNNVVQNNSHEVESTLKSLNTVVAATVQQSLKSELLEFKSSSVNKWKLPQYDTVIIDEAARSSPVDLLIPMVQAAKRIILIGDHKQLPHIVDDVVEQDLENLDLEAEMFKLHSQLNDGTVDSSDDRANAQTKTTFKSNGILIRDFNKIDANKLLKLSMFEYLFHNLRKLELADGITRTITLNSQFRMHHRLGELVSKEFYDGKIESPLRDKQEIFDHSLVGVEHKFACWFNVRSSSGLATKEAHSWGRSSEAKAIIEKLVTWLQSPSSQGLSFGVICFYRSQVELLMTYAKQYQLFVPRIDGQGFDLARKFDDKHVLDRLRIGTVDSFQGKEFDVVILSMVRSVNDNILQSMLDRIPNVAPVANNKANQATQKDWGSDKAAKIEQYLFGHLMSNNRLCVALSRQRRLLCVFGDRAMIEHDIGQHAVPALSSFLDLCKSSDGIFNV